MKKWLGEFLNKVRFEKSRRSDIYIEQIARDKTGKWVTDNEKKLVYKNDDPKRIEKFTKAQESLNNKKKCCGGECVCSPTKKPTVSKKLEEVKVEAKRQQEKYGTQKPVAKKKPTGGGTKKELPLE
jgi:hypothetical protein